MEKIIVFGLNFEDVQQISRAIAKKLNLKFFNAKQIFNKTLLKSAVDPVLLVDDILNEKESLLCAQLAEQNGVVAMSDDMFLSNENYKYFKNFTKILIKSKTNSKLKQNIENLLQTHATITASSLEEVFEKLKG